MIYTVYMSYISPWLPWNISSILQKTKEDRQKKQKAEKKIVDPNKPKRPASSFFLFSKEERKTISEERPGINNSTLNALISVKWKVNES